MLRLVLLSLALASGTQALADNFHFSRVSQDARIEKMTVCNDGKIFALFTDGYIRSSMSGRVGSFTSARAVIGGTVQSMACAGQTLYYLTTDRNLFWFHSSSIVRAGRPGAAAEIAGGDDGHDGFPVVYALNDDRNLYRNDSAGSDRGWRHMGYPFAARKIAALSVSTVLAINDDGALYLNSASGNDSSWVRHGVCGTSLTDTESVGLFDAGRKMYVLKPDGTLLLGSRSTFNCFIRFPLPNPIPVPIPVPTIRP